MKNLGLLLVALVVLSGQMHAATPAPQRTLVYQFGYNTAAAAQGQGTGTTTIEIFGKAKDGGVLISGIDSWWNTVRPRGTNTCELYANGNVFCLNAPYAISPMQFTIFPLLAHSFFASVPKGGMGNWSQSYEVKAALVPGQSTYAGQLTTWQCAFNMQGKGPLPNTKGTLEIQGTGTVTQVGGRYLKATSKQTIAFDPVAKVPLVVRDTRTYVPQHSVYSNGYVELKLLKDSNFK